MPRPRKVDIRKAARDIVLKDLSLADAGALQNVSPQAIHQQLQSPAGKAELDKWIKNRANEFAAKQRIILNYLDEDSAKRMMDKHPGSAALWFNSLFNNERLERGQSTDNISVQSVATEISATLAEYRQHSQRLRQVMEDRGLE